MSPSPPDRDAPIRQRSLRTHNLGLVLRHVSNQPVPVSRAEVAAATGLTRATVSTLVDELLSGALLTEVDPAPRTGAGRPGVGLCLATTGPAGLGLEVNVDYLAACVVDLTGAVRHRDVRPGDQRGRPPAAVLADLATLAGAAILATAALDCEVAGAAVAVPGLVADGIVRLAPNLGWADLDLRPLFARAPLAGLAPELCTVENEANLAALAELHSWPGPTAPSFLYVSGEIGVGAGVVLDGRLFRGGRGFGGELGHVTIRPDGPSCRCGARGCLEAYANQEAILRAAGLDPPTQDVTDLVARAESGTGRAVRALTAAGSALGIAVAAVVNLLDLDTIVLGGAYAPLTPWLTPPVLAEVSARVLTARWQPVTVRASALGGSASVVGAAGSVVRAIRDSPDRWLARRPDPVDHEVKRQKTRSTRR